MHIRALSIALLLLVSLAVPWSVRAKDAPVSQPIVENHDGVPGVWLDGPDGFDIAAKMHLETGKPLLVYVYTDWCPYCRKLNREILPHPEIQQCLSGFSRVKINAEEDPRARELAHQLRISGYPTLLVRQKGDLMMRPFPTIVKPERFLAACRQEQGRTR
ncbi:MAG: thioredoxin family protein [Candidatus Dadabacteria bacterium]|nr:MAG: thioredoxin family protein [Candidatus Dadabacteria bacterium]